MVVAELILDMNKWMMNVNENLSIEINNDDYQVKVVCFRFVSFGFIFNHH